MTQQFPAGHRDIYNKESLATKMIPQSHLCDVIIIILSILCDNNVLSTLMNNSNLCTPWKFIIGHY